MFVCLSAFYRPHDICPLCGAASESESRSPGAGKHAQREHARMPYNFSTKKSYADAFQKLNRRRAHAVVYVTAEIFKKGKNRPSDRASYHYKDVQRKTVVQFAPLLIIDVFLNQVTSVVLVSLYFMHFMTIYIVIRPLIQSHL